MLVGAEVRRHERVRGEIAGSQVGREARERQVELGAAGRDRGEVERRVVAGGVVAGAPADACARHALGVGPPRRLREDARPVALAPRPRRAVRPVEALGRARDDRQVVGKGRVGHRAIGGREPAAARQRVQERRVPVDLREAVVLHHDGDHVLDVRGRRRPGAGAAGGLRMARRAASVRARGRRQGHDRRSNESLQHRGQTPMLHQRSTLCRDGRPRHRRDRHRPVGRGPRLRALREEAAGRDAAPAPGHDGRRNRRPRGRARRPPGPALRPLRRRRRPAGAGRHGRHHRRVHRPPGRGRGARLAARHHPPGRSSRRATG